MLLADVRGDKNKAILISRFVANKLTVRHSQSDHLRQRYTLSGQRRPYILKVSSQKVKQMSKCIINSGSGTAAFFVFLL